MSDATTPEWVYVPFRVVAALFERDCERAGCVKSVEYYGVTHAADCRNATSALEGIFVGKCFRAGVEADKEQLEKTYGSWVRFTQDDYGSVAELV